MTGQIQNLGASNLPSHTVETDERAAALIAMKIGFRTAAMAAVPGMGLICHYMGSAKGR